MIYIRLYGGQQDGLCLPTNHAPDVVWVSTIEEERRQAALREQGIEPEPLIGVENARSTLLPYTKYRCLLDTMGNTIFDYEFSEALLLYQDEESSS